MRLWHKAGVDLPRTKTEILDGDDEKREVLLSDPVLVYCRDGSMCTCRWHEDPVVDFFGWIDCGDGCIIEGVTHWTELPKAPKEAPYE